MLFASQDVHKSMPVEEGGSYIKCTFFFAMEDSIHVELDQAEQACPHACVLV